MPSLNLPFLSSVLLICRIFHSASAAGGRWQLLHLSIGISAMHMQLLNNDRVIIFDRTDFGKSNLSLPEGKCRYDRDVGNFDCTAHAVEYEVLTNNFRPLFVQTDVWCSSGSAAPNGSLIQTGGFNDGERRVRVFDPCPNCDWVEIGDSLLAVRWYATNQILPDGRQIIIGGRGQFNYEFYPKDSSPELYNLPFLAETNDKGIENNLYPFVFLNVDGNLFIFANNRAVLFDYRANKVVRSYPEIPGGDPRCYPSTGSAVLLPVRSLTVADIQAEVLVCGGAPKGSFTRAMNGEFVRALDTCGRIRITDPNPSWVVERMPVARTMGDMILLPDGNVLIINGGGSGTAAWELGRDPVLNPVLYRPENPVGSRFEVMTATTIPRMYHSAAVLVRDGRVLVGGSNPNPTYIFTGVLFPTELSLEAFYPPYLDEQFNDRRPFVISPIFGVQLGYGKLLVVRFNVTGVLNVNATSVKMVFPSFTTHSFAMNQRVLDLGNEKLTTIERTTFDIQVTTPPKLEVSPPGFYMLYVVHQGVPSQGTWVQMK